MKKSELNELCTKITEAHAIELSRELQKSLLQIQESSESLQETVVASVSAASAGALLRSVQATADIIVSLGLLDVEQD